MEKEYFGNLGKGDFLYYYGTYNGSISVEVYKIINKKVSVKKFKFGGKEVLCEFTVYPFKRQYYSSNNDWFYDEDKHRKIVLHANKRYEYDNGIYRYGSPLWYASLNQIVDNMKNYLEYQDILKTENVKIYRYYKDFAKEMRYEYNEWKRVHIGAFAKNDRGNYPKLVTWSQVKQMYLNSEIDTDLKCLLDWNQCFYYGFVKFQYDPYTGREIDWKKINKEVSDLMDN